MKVARNTTHNLRHDWLSVAANRRVAEVSLLALRTEICVDVTINGKREEAYWAPEKLAAVLAKQIQEDEAAERTR